MGVRSYSLLHDANPEQSIYSFHCRQRWDILQSRVAGWCDRYFPEHTREGSQVNLCHGFQDSFLIAMLVTLGVYIFTPLADAHLVALGESYFFHKLFFEWF